LVIGTVVGLGASALVFGNMGYALYKSHSLKSGYEDYTNGELDRELQDIRDEISENSIKSFFQSDKIGRINAIKSVMREREKLDYYLD
jgi:LPS O-antigen subunit length determinant protein (WzzB/FepE family)